MRSNSDTQLLSEQYINNLIKRHIIKLIKEGKSKEQIQQILQEAGFLQNMVQGAKNAYQNYWQDPRAIRAGQNAGYGTKGQEARKTGQEAYNRQLIRKFEKQVQDTMKSMNKLTQGGINDLRKKIFNSSNKLFTAIQEEGPNLDPNFLIKQFDILINTLNEIGKNSVDGITKTIENLLNQATTMKNGMVGGMQQQQQQQAPQQQQPPQQAPQQQQKTPPPQAGSFQGAGGSPQNVVGVNNNNAAQLQTASTKPRIYKRDYVLMESAYEQVKKNGLVID